MNKVRMLIGIALLSVMTLVLGACTQTTTPTPSPTPVITTPPTIYTGPELEYKLIAAFPDLFYVDPDFYPVARVGVEATNAQLQFPVISANVTEFPAILAHLWLPNKAEYTPDEMLAIYREHKKLSLGIAMSPSKEGYYFILRTGQNQGERIEGTITLSGEINVLIREPSFNTYPICLTAGTLIDTPEGQVPVEQLQQGMSVWSVDIFGNRMPATILKTSRTEVPPGFKVIRVTLSDGRSVTASPSHPSAEARALGDYKVGETMDGATVAAIQSLAYDAEATYDILPAGPTGVYWANGILLGSTLK